MSENDWMYEMERMLAGFEQHATSSLENIIKYFEAMNRPFDDDFRKVFLQVSNDRLSTVYSIIQMNWRWRQRGYENEASQKSKPKDSELNDGFLKSNDIASRNLYNLRRKSINHLPSSENRRTSEFRERIKFNEKLRCHHCSRYFVTVQSLKQHQITHKSKKFPFICHGCFVRFPTVKTKLAHDRECTRRQFQCYMCEDIVYHQKERLISHMTQHTGQKPFQCQICMKYFMSQNYLKRHLNNIHLSKGQKSYF